MAKERMKEIGSRTNHVGVRWLIFLLITSGFLFVVNSYADVPVTRFRGYVTIGAGLFLLVILILLVLHIVHRSKKTLKISLIIVSFFFY